MSLLATLKGAALYAQGLDRLASALERVADALERVSPVPPGDSEDASGVFYIDRAADAALERRQDDYLALTGIQLPPGMEPPRAEQWMEK